MIEPRERLIVALDVNTAAEARRLAGALGDAAGVFKVGKQLFTAAGPSVVRDLVASGRKVFLDLKFHDIPNTVAGAVREAGRLGASMLTVHASGGAKMLRAAAEAAAGGPLVLAVTVLTSLGDEDLREIGVSGRVLDQALRLAALARDNGCGGVVASPQEVRELRRELGGGFAIVTPGIRPAGESAGDQARVATPTDAIRAGATYLVVGRPITGAADPAAEAGRIVAEIAAACH
jgi:orotidine-5'-phosphate decarboxylase